MLMWEEAAIKDDVIEYDIAFNIIYIMRTHVVVAKLRYPPLTNRHVRATVLPQRSLLSKREMARRDEIVVATKTFFPWRNSPNTGFLSRKAIFQSIDDSLMRLGMDYVDLFQIHRFDYSTPVEETMEALHDVVKAGKARYIGASSMEAWRFAKMQHTAERNGWTRFITMQPQYNLLYREEEREMLPLCEDQGVGVIPWSPMARGRLTRDWSVTSRRTQNDAFALKMYENAALLDKPVIDVVASIAEKHAVPRAHRRQYGRS